MVQSYFLGEKFIPHLEAVCKTRSTYLDLWMPSLQRELLGRVSKWNVIIHSDSQAAIWALSSNMMNSKTVYGCCRYLDEIAERQCYPYRIHTNIIGHYNLSVRIIDLVSHTTYVVCVNFIHKWRDLQFKVDSERQIFEKLFMAAFFTPRVFARNLLRGNRRRNTFRILF